jgi:hypothetical protein
MSARLIPILGPLGQSSRRFALAPFSARTLVARAQRNASSQSSSPSDPFPLPLSDPQLAAGSGPALSSQGDRLAEDEEWAMPAPLDRTGEDEKTMRARLVYQTRKRGTLETDLLLSTFGRDELKTMKVEELKQFDKVRSLGLLSCSLPRDLT